ncbi:hypothetical protein RZS08_42645, partial [Arthrospira platensis SPKY1]|nr:hypothetical protein [Arthrospira platensis SPKY1]
MDFETYQALVEWYREKYRPTIPRNALVPFEDWVYSKTSDRFYLSKWLEKFILKYIEIEFPTWVARKVDNRGEQILKRNTIRYVNRTETTYKMEGYRKDPNQIKGEPDIKVL